MATTAVPAPAPEPAAGSGKRIGIIAAIVAGLAVVLIGGYYGFQALFPDDSPGRTAGRDAPAPSAQAPVPEPAKVAVATPQGPAQDTVAMQPNPVTPPPTEVKPAVKEPTSVPGIASAGKAPEATVAKADSSKAPPAKAGASLATPGATPSAIDTAAAPAAATQQAAQPNRWQLMREAMARCAGDNFFKRVACEQGVGLQYCEGYWGKVPQCPSGPPAKDRGQ